MPNTPQLDAVLDAREVEARAAVRRAEQRLRKIQKKRADEAAAAIQLRDAALGHVVEALGLFAPHAEEFHLALAQLATLWQHPLAWAQFISGALVQEWLGPDGMKAVVPGKNGQPLAPPKGP
jgi:hypothetical protein